MVKELFPEFWSGLGSRMVAAQDSTREIAQAAWHAGAASTSDRLKLFVWPKRGFIAIAFAHSTEEARELLLEEINGDGSDGSFPAVTRAVEAVKTHRPQVFGYLPTAEFAPTDSGDLEATENQLKEVMHAAENLYAFAEAFGEELLTDEGKRQVSAAYEVLRKNGSKMFAPKWGGSAQ